MLSSKELWGEEKKKGHCSTSCNADFQAWKKEKLHIQPEQFSCVETVFAIWELATDYLYYSLSMMEVYVTYCVLNFREKQEKALLCNTSQYIRRRWKYCIAWAVMTLLFQKTMNLDSFSLCLAFGFMSYVIRRDFRHNSDRFFFKLKKTGFHHHFMNLSVHLCQKFWLFKTIVRITLTAQINY